MGVMAFIQTIKWYTPEERLPPEDVSLVALIDGKAGNKIFDHAMVILEWSNDDGWWSMEYDFDEFRVIAWCDLYEGVEDECKRDT